MCEIDADSSLFGKHRSSIQLADTNSSHLQSNGRVIRLSAIVSSSLVKGHQHTKFQLPVEFSESGLVNE